MEVLFSAERVTAGVDGREHRLSLQGPATSEIVAGLTRLLFRRNFKDDNAYLESLLKEGVTVEALICQMLSSKDFYLAWANEFEKRRSLDAIDGPMYRVPDNLSVQHALPNDILLVGSCLFDDWIQYASEVDTGVRAEHIVFNNASILPDLGSERIKTYSYQLCQVPLRSILKEGEFWGANYRNAFEYEAMFERVKRSLVMNLGAICRYNSDYGLQTFVLNFVVPQQNPMGRLQDRYYLGNLVYFIEELNRYLAELISKRTNCFLIDFDQIVSIFGEKYFSDDLVSHLNHSSNINNSILKQEDRRRLEPTGDVFKLYTPNTEKIVKAVIAEAEANLRTIAQRDVVKLAIFDLDDTLWRGVGAEQEVIDALRMTEGWPLSIVEAASFLWRRGVLIAIVSKNDERTALTLWEKLYGSRFSMKNFVATRINWKPKAENIQEILQAVNLLPSSALFIDDNPVERAAVKAAFPGMRVMDAALANWRRILLWAPELQRSVITAESSQRTQMIQAQIHREDIRQSLSREEFLKTQSVVVTPFEVSSTSDPRFARCFELLNKTNQFNTTGRRWTEAEIGEFFVAEGRLLAFDIRDKYTSYGLTALMLVARDAIEQFVMSCRVFGMEIERACVAIACDAIATSCGGAPKAKIKATDRNVLSMNVYENANFVNIGGGLWELTRERKPTVPEHIAVEIIQ